MVQVPNPDGGGGTVPVTLACLGGDGGNHYQVGTAPVRPSDRPNQACNAGFQQFPGGQNQFRQFQGYGDVNQQENTTNGSYNAFQGGVRLQNKWGLSGELDYTYSHEIDITSYDLNGVSNPWNLKYDKGSGALDRRHIWSANYIYQLPFFNKDQGLVKMLLGGWEIAGTFVDQTGVPVPVTGAGGVNIPCGLLPNGDCDPNLPANQGGWDSVGLGGGYTVRPNVSGKMRYNKSMWNFFDANMFSNATPQWNGGPNLGFGNAGKDAVVGPGRVNFTTSLYKSFAIKEVCHFELRFESFNTFNHTEKNGMNTSFAPQNGAPYTKFGGNNTFGQVTSTWDPRTLELGGKFVF
jgi:hypothetical protein